MINAHGPLPLHYQLRSLLEEKISSAAWKSGEKISSEAELSQMFNVSRTTVRQAIGDLVVERKLIRTQGVGTFVAQYVQKPNFFLKGFSMDMQTRGCKPSSLVLKFAVIQPSAEMVTQLKLGKGEPVIEINRLRKANEQTIAMDYTVLPYFRFSTLTQANVENRSLYAVLQNSFNVIPTRSNRSVESLHCPSVEAKLMKIPVGSPILFFSGTNYDQYDQSFEFSRSYYRGDRYILNIEVFNNHIL